jgi:hypothetical protein
MRRNIFAYFEVAAQTAQSKKDARSFLLGAIGIRSDGVMVKALNGPTAYPIPAAHAESRCCKKCDIGAIIYVARIAIGSGKFANSRPCKYCQNTMRSRGIRLAYYTINSSEFGMIDFGNNTERSWKVLDNRSNGD